MAERSPSEIADAIDAELRDMLDKMAQHSQRLGISIPINGATLAHIRNVGELLTELRRLDTYLIEATDEGENQCATT